jgi:hypothetical protein
VGQHIADTGKKVSDELRKTTKKEQSKKWRQEDETTKLCL